MNQGSFLDSRSDVFSEFVGEGFAQVEKDGVALAKVDVVVHEARNCSKRIYGQILGLLLLTFKQIDVIILILELSNRE